MELDAAAAPDGTILDGDVAIVGAGPAGIVLAHELLTLHESLRVLVIESGGAIRTAEVEELSAGDAVGDPYPDLRLTRSRGIGGTAALWNTLFQGAAFAKYLPLDPVDFERREGMEWSGWPIGASVLEPYYRRAHAIAGLGSFEYGVAPGREHRALDLGGGLINSVYRLGPADPFMATLPDRLAQAASVQLVRGATVTELVRSRSGERIAELRWTTLSGRRGTVRAARFVLAAGAIENARLLLLARLRNDWLGRGFMEHPIDRSLRLTTRAPALRADPGFYSTHLTPEGTPFMGRVALAADLLRSEKLPNATVRLLSDAEPAILQSALLNPVARRLAPRAARRTIGNAIRRISCAVRGLGGRRYHLLLDLEQAPHPENRVVLSDQRDRFGQPRAALDWRWRPEDEARRERVRLVVARELASAGAGRVEIAAEGPLDPVAHHHAGTTRMHGDPAQGVVDQDLRVHGVENLFVTGASVFPTAGVANPTLTVLALSLRLADRLAARPVP